MAYEYRVFDVPGLVAGEDLSETSGLTGSTGSGGSATGQHLGAYIATDGTVKHISNVTQRPIGIIQNNPKSGAGVDVRAIGLSKVVAGGTLTPGDEFGFNTAGRALSKSHAFTGTNFNEWICGVVLGDVAVAAGELATVYIYGGYPVA